MQSVTLVQAVESTVQFFGWNEYESDLHDSQPISLLADIFNESKENIHSMMIVYMQSNEYRKIWEDRTGKQYPVNNELIHPQKA